MEGISFLAHFGLEVLQRLQCYEPQLTKAHDRSWYTDTDTDTDPDEPI